MPSPLAKKIIQITAVTLLLALIGVVSIWAQQPWLVPSLGSAAFIQIMTPTTPSAQIWPTGVGQLCGVAGGFAGVYAAAATAAPSFMGDHKLVFIRVLAVAIAVAVTATLQFGVKAVSAAGGTLALLVALGSESPSWAGALRLVIGVVLVTGVGEAERRLILLMEK